MNTYHYLVWPWVQVWLLQYSMNKSIELLESWRMNRIIS